MDLNEAAKQLYLRSSQGWRNAIPWEQLEEESKEIYRDWIKRSITYHESLNEQR